MKLQITFEIELTEEECAHPDFLRGLKDSEDPYLSMRISTLQKYLENPAYRAGLRAGMFKPFLLERGVNPISAINKLREELRRR